MERRELMDVNTYRDMHLLDELMGRPDTTQRELSKRIGVALGLTNLMLRRLVKKGYVKISGTKRSRLRYLITPTGLLEKTRLTYQFVEYSLQLYSRVRRSLRVQLAALSRSSSRRILLFGTGELAELAFLTIQEIGLEVAGVAEEVPKPGPFLGYPVQRIAEVSPEVYDRLIVASLDLHNGAVKRLVAMGIPPDRIITLTSATLPTDISAFREGSRHDPDQHATSPEDRAGLEPDEVGVERGVQVGG